MNKFSGFTLLEVLITLVVMSIGLLGLAALQVSSLRNNQSAEQRSQATELAYSMSDRMRVNGAYIKSNLGGNNYVALSAALATSQASCNSSPGCDSTSMAQHDLFEWNRNIESVLPGGVGEISVSGALSEAVYTINVKWVEVDISGSVRTFNNGFSMEFQP